LFLFCSNPSKAVIQIEDIGAEIEPMRSQTRRQRGEIRQLERAAISSLAREALLARTQMTVDDQCAERDKVSSGENTLERIGSFAACEVRKCTTLKLDLGSTK
jgi:hypothetical protein